ncbi:MAG TPA: lipoyl(octanoyl) transferase LipB, partial [Hyphomicrobiaceae bacterium]|nr:lipoyl(octanoyl) transferase LipB [Hyphomicrobiaceae bacterium]
MLHPLPSEPAAAATGAGPPVAWLVTQDPVPYEAACRFMAERVAAIVAGTAPELAWLLEHPPLYTAGTSANPEDLVLPAPLPVYRTGRGGQYTYHGPGQRVAYVMLDVKRRFGDVRAYVAALEDWVIAALAFFHVRGERWPGRVGVWVCRGDKARANHAGTRDKIAAIGVRLSRW